MNKKLVIELGWMAGMPLRIHLFPAPNTVVIGMLAFLYMSGGDLNPVLVLAEYMFLVTEPSSQSTTDF